MPTRSRRARSRAALGTAAVAVVLALAIPAVAAADWGAIALDPHTGKVGLSYDYSSAGRAKHRALKECHRLGCRVAVYVHDGWGALVQKRTNGYYFAGYGPSKAAAFQEATRRAHDFGARHVADVFSGY
jgi:opacity protein-like surface antigen